MRALLTSVAGVGTAGLVAASNGYSSTHHVSAGFGFWCAVGAGVCMAAAMWLLVGLFRPERDQRDRSDRHDAGPEYRDGRAGVYRSGGVR